jgi:hypothetical protein
MTFRKDVLLSSSGFKNKYETSRITAAFCWSTDLLFNHEDGRTKSFRNVRKFVSDYKTTFPRRVTAVRTSNSAWLLSNWANGFLPISQPLISLQISVVRGNTTFQSMLYKAGCKSVKGEERWDGRTRSTQAAHEKYAHHFSRVIWRKESAWHTQTHTGRWHILTVYFTIKSVEALCYKLEGRGFETWWCERIFFFNLPNPSGRTKPWGLLNL